MFKVSEAFNKEINKLQGRKFNAKVIIRDKEYSGNQIYEMNLEESVNPSDSFSIGSICSNSFDIKLINTGDIFDNAIVKPYVGLYIGDDIEYIPLGVFTVIKTSVKGKFINLECVDNMIGLEKVYFSDLSYPADINDIAKEICKKAGVNLASKLPNYRVNKIEGYSLREAIGFIASLCGSFARFNRIGDLEVRDYEVVKQEMTPHNLFKLDIEANECIIKKVIAQKGEEELSTGTDDGNKIVFNNPIITKEILNDIYTKYNEFKYIPYTAKWKGNPAIMAGDILNLTDLKGNKYNALIMEQKFTYKNGISSEVKAKGKTRQDSGFDSKGSVTQSMERYSIEQANIKKALIDKASINDLTAVDAKIQRLYTEDLTAIRADIVNLNSKKANIVELNAVRADLQQAIIGKANITDLNAAVAKVGILENKTAVLENALAGNLTADNFKANSITAGSGIIANGAIGDAQISALSANKITTGTIDTSLVTVVGPNGRLRLQGNKLQIFDNKDGKLYERIILGVDSNNNSSLVLRGEDGRTVLLNQDGLTKEGLTDGFNKIDDNSIDATRIFDKNSLVRNINGATETIRGTRVQIGDRTLDVELGIQSNTITEQGKVLDSQKATITALQDAIKLKVDNQTFTSATQTINRNILGAKEEAKSDAKAYSDALGQQLKDNAQKYANDVAIAKAELAKQQAIANADGKITEEEKKRIKQAEDNLNTAIAKANEAENKAREYADAKKIEAINKASADAALKAAEALNSAKAFTTAEISTTNSNLHKVTAEINILKDRIESKVGTADVEKAIQNIEFGGRNLFLKSKGPFKSSNEYVGISITSVVEKYLNKKITISADVKANKSGTISFYSLGGYSVGFCVDREVTTEWTRIKATGKFTLNDEKQKWCNLSFYGNYGSGLFTEVRNVKIELGELASDWSPAPEDTDQLIVESQNVVTEKIKVVESNLTQTKNSIEASVRDLDSQTKAITTNVTNINNDLINKINTAKGDAINQAKLDAKDYTNAQISTVNTKVHNVESNLNILKDKIESKVGQSDIDKSISNITIGVRNLIPYSNKLSKWQKESGLEAIDNSSYCSIIRKVESSDNRGCYIDIAVKENTKYTISLNTKQCNGNLGIGSFIQGHTNWNYYLNGYKRLESNSFNHYTFITESGENKIRIYLTVSGGLPINTQTQIVNIKLEEGEFATPWTEAPEDTNQLVVDSIKVVDTKISDVSSKITQLRDSVAIDINSINSKTHTIETTLGGKASKQEVTEVNNRMATIKANLDSITQRVSSTESKTNSLETNINSKASKQELTVVNDKVTEVTASLNGITQRVGNTESRINSLNGQVANAVTRQQFTEFQQSNNKFVMDLASSGGCNLVRNSAFESQDWRNWTKWGSIADPVVWKNNEPSGHKWACKIITTGSNQGIQQQITGLIIGKVYTFSCKVWSTRGVIGAMVSNAGVYNGNHFGGAQNVWGEINFTFTAKENTTTLYLGVVNNKCTPGDYWVTGIQLTEGNCKQPWSQHPNENYNTSFTFDNEGLEAKFNDGSHTKMSHGGFEWFDANNMSHAYHCLMEVGIFNLKQYGNGNYTRVKIQLPAYFRNKYFKVIACPSGWSVGQTNLDSLTVIVESYDIANATFTIKAFAHSVNEAYQNNINISWMATA